jgi:hypothetical protein
MGSGGGVWVGLEVGGGLVGAFSHLRAGRAGLCQYKRRVVSGAAVTGKGYFPLYRGGGFP